MKIRKLTVIVVATLALGACCRLGQVGLSGAAQAAPAEDKAQSDAQPPASLVYSTDQAIQMFQDRVKGNPQDFVSLTLLAHLHIRKARETGDYASYDQAEAALRRALELDRDYPSAQATLAVVYGAQHKFAEGLQLAQQVYQKNPSLHAVLQIVGDAHLELGNYPEAEKAYQELVRRDPLAEMLVSVLARQARLAELKGQTPAALDLMRRAGEEDRLAGGSKESGAWYAMRLGEIHFNAGRLEEAAPHFEAALRGSPRYPAALARLGKVRAAQGKTAEAIDLYKRAVVPHADLAMLAELGDLYARTGNDFLARLNYEKLERAARDKPACNRELSVFYTNHDRNLAEALELAKADLASRKDIYAYDTLAWALYKNKRFQEAAQAMERALRLSTQDANLYYHAGLICQSLDQKEKARGFLDQALRLNPHFSFLHAEDARRRLSALGGKLALPTAQP